MEHSEKIDQIATALLKFQTKVDHINKGEKADVKSKDGKFLYSYKYADLSSVMNAIKEPLQACGLLVIQSPSGENGLSGMIIHAESGQWFKDSFIVKPKESGPQPWGSIITYAKRYQVGAMLHLNIDEDNDAVNGETTVTNEDSTIPDNDTPPCPQCFKSDSVMLSKYEGPAYYCNNKRGGCGHKFDFFPPDKETPTTVDGETLSFLGDPKAEASLDKTTLQLEDSIEMETVKVTKPPGLAGALEELGRCETFESLNMIIEKYKRFNRNKEFIARRKEIKSNIEAELK